MFSPYSINTTYARLILKSLLRFIHVGKCGGSTIEKLLHESPLIAQTYKRVIQSHVCGVSIDTNCDYLICLRNPISRAISAYEWRRKLVVTDSLPNQSNRFRGEYDALTSYNSFSELASKLYQNNSFLDELVARDFQLIHHLRESISFYLKPLMPVLSAHNVYGVICQESLSADCEELLGIVPTGIAERKNYSRREFPSTLSISATSNLKRYLYDDYACLLGLWSAGILNDSKLQNLMFGV